MSYREADLNVNSACIREAVSCPGWPASGCYKYVRPHTVFARVCLSEMMSTGMQGPETFLGFCCGLAVLYAFRLLEIMQTYLAPLNILCL